MSDVMWRGIFGDFFKDHEVCATCGKKVTVEEYDMYVKEGATYTHKKTKMCLWHLRNVNGSLEDRVQRLEDPPKKKWRLSRWRKKSYWS